MTWAASVLGEGQRFSPVHPEGARLDERTAVLYTFIFAGLAILVILAVFTKSRRR